MSGGARGEAGPGAEGGAPDRLHAAIAVIGSGPGGAVTACMLAEAGHDVLLLEEGDAIAPATHPAFSPAEMAGKLRAGGQTMAVGRGIVAFWEGRCVGGGSEVNRGLYHRPSAPVIAGWARRVDGLSHADLVARAAAIEATARVQRLPGPAPRVSRRLADGAAALGWDCMEVPRLWAYRDDWATAPATGQKQSMFNTFVPRFEAAGGRLRPGLRVRRLRREDGRWRLEASMSGAAGRRRVEIRAERVFVACGATQTPALLRRSGITRRVGDTLGFHTMIKAVARFDDDVARDLRLDPVHQVKQFDPAFSLGASVSLPATTTFGLSDRPDILATLPETWPHLGTYYAQTAGGRGRVRLMPGHDDPLVLSHTPPQDMRDLAEGLRRLCACLFAAGAREIYPNIEAGPTLRGPADLSRLPAVIDPRRVSLSTLHLLASCPMGRDPDASVADSFGRVRDADDLWLADSSMLPGVTVVNPQGTIMAMAHRNAEAFLERAAAARRRQPMPVSS